MPRGVSHPPEFRAQVVAAVLAGAGIAQVAARFKLDKGLVSRWVATVATDHRARAREPQDLAELILDLIGEHITTLRAELQATARPEWLAQQNARDLAELVGTQRDTLLRLLAGLRPVDTQPDELPGPPDAPPGATTDAR